MVVRFRMLAVSWIVVKMVAGIAVIMVAVAMVISKLRVRLMLKQTVAHARVKLDSYLCVVDLHV